MSFSLEKVVPWGRLLSEYESMFSLSEEDLGKQLLGCGDGPAGFNADLTRRGGNVISVDPLYQYTSTEIKERIDVVYELMMEQTRKNSDEFMWTRIRTVEELGCIRMEAMNQFLEDYPKGKGRYVFGELPVMPFEDRLFDIALCSHFLFLYSEQFSKKFHLQSVKELCRVASEVRIFPLVELGANKSRHLDEVVEELNKCGYECIIEKVDYEFKRGANEMLRVKSSNQQGERTLEDSRRSP